MIAIPRQNWDKIKSTVCGNGVGFLAFLGIFGNYDKPGPGVNKDEPPKAAPVRFFEILLRKFGQLVQLNLIFLIPFAAAVVLMVLLYLSPTHFMLQLPTASGALQVDIWAMYAAPLPLVLLAPFTAGLTFVTRNYAREEHAFVWSDFWENVKGNWKYFLLNGAVVYLVYVILSFSIMYYYNATSRGWLYYIPFWVCLVLAVFFLFAQYQLDFQPKRPHVEIQPSLSKRFHSGVGWLGAKFADYHHPGRLGIRGIRVCSSQWPYHSDPVAFTGIFAVFPYQLLHQFHRVPSGGPVFD